MKNTITNNTAGELSRVASMFTTGGGVPLTDQVLTLKKLGKFSIPLVTLNDLPDDGSIITAAELGPTDVPPLEKSSLIPKMLHALERTQNTKIVGIYPPEIGQESVVIETAVKTKLPIVDLDVVGFRAVPYIDINIFNLNQYPFSYTPMIIGTDHQEVMAIQSQVTYQRLEKILRNMTTLSHSGVLFLIGGIINVKKLKEKKIDYPSYSRLLRYTNHTTSRDLLADLKPSLVIEGTVINRSEFSEQGFLADIATIKETSTAIEYQLVILNECLFILKNNKIVASVPDKIIIINPNKCIGVSCVELKKSMKILLAVIPADKQWQAKNASLLFGKKRFEKILHRIINK